MKACPDWKRTAITAAFAILTAGSVCSADTLMYVDSTASSNGDGGSWDEAYRFLGDAIAAAVESGDSAELHLAQGTYRPDRGEAFPDGSGDRFATFQLASGVRILGGYAGLGSADADTRDPDLYVTILSGDLAGDDLPGFVNNDENSYHVVTGTGVDQTAFLDGVTITAGHANGDANPACFGGPSHGIPCATGGDCPEGSCVSLDSTGAGLLSVAGRPSIVNCRIVDNFAFFQGAGMMLKAGSDLVIADSTFVGNRALDNGGALYMGQSSPFIIRCDFIANQGGRYAGASCNRDHSDAQFIDCLFEQNTAAESTDTGGGAVVNASSSPTFRGCTFRENHSISGKGGGVYSKQGFHPELGPSRAEIVDCVFDGNQALSNGGAVYDEEGSETTVSGCEFTGNTADLGGAVYTTSASTTSVTDSQFDMNHAGFGGAVYNNNGSTTALTSSIFDTNSVDVMGGAVYSNGVLTIDECELRFNSAGQDGGAVYNAGGSIALTGGVVEYNEALGAYGGGVYAIAILQVDGVRFEENEAAGMGGGIYSPGSSNAVIWATNCTFHANRAGNRGGGAYGAGFISNSVFTENEGGDYGGGFYGDNTIRTIDITDCVFDANRAGRGGGLYLGGPAFGQPVAVSACAFRANAADIRNGGGLQITNSPATVVDCTFDMNTSAARGGGISIDGGTIATLISCVLTNNWAATNGGGIRVADGSAVLIDDFIIQGSSSSTGGGIYLNASGVSMNDCRILGNVGSTWGGALYSAFSDFAMTNCTVNGNVAYERGGGLHLFQCNPTITNCTLTANVALQMGGGIFNHNEANPIITSSVLWGNNDAGGSGEPAQITDYIDSLSVVNYSCVQGWTGAFGGDGNIGADPLFVDPIGPDSLPGTDDDDLRLDAGSPSIDAGDNDAVPKGVVTDLAGDARFVDDPNTTDTGYGEAPIVDMGAYEVQMTACPADVDGDGIIGFSDVLRILAAWGSSGGPEDVDGDGQAGFGDVLTVLSEWGPCPE